MLQFGALLTDDASNVNYNRNMFMQVTGRVTTDQIDLDKVKLNCDTVGKISDESH
jgi:hypothetical protein